LLACPPLAQAPERQDHKHRLRRHPASARMRLHLRRRERRTRRLPGDGYSLQQAAPRLAVQDEPGRRHDAPGYQRRVE
jgi:hypothetical protein